MTRIVVVASVRLFCEAITLGLAADGSLLVVGSTHELDRATDLLREARADVVLLDLMTPDALAAVRPWAEHLPDVRVVALTVTPRLDEVVACVRAGIAGILSRDASLADLSRAVHACRRGEFPCCPKAARLLADELRGARDARSLGRERGPDPRFCEAASRLTRRELEIVPLLRDRLSNKEIARRLSIDVSTVKNHVHRILEKVGVERREQVVEIQRD